MGVLWYAFMTTAGPVYTTLERSQLIGYRGYKQAVTEFPESQQQSIWEWVK